MLKELIHNLFTQNIQYYQGSLEDIVKREVAKERKIDERKLPEVIYKYLPTICLENFCTKVSGLYNRLKHIIVIDPIDFKNSGLYQKVKILAEEYLHAADHIKGKSKKVYRNFKDYLKNYHRDKDEIRVKRDAEKIADIIVRNIGAYGLY